MAELSGFNLPCEREHTSDALFRDGYGRMLNIALNRGPLGQGECELVGLAINAATTHFNVTAARAHSRAALANGASEREIVEVLKLVSVLGIHTMTICLGDVAEIYAEQRQTVPDVDQARVRRSFTASRGAWSELWGPLLSVDPAFLDAYDRLSSAPEEAEYALSPGFRELVYIAVDAATHHLMLPGVRYHVERAKALGVSFDAVIQVLELASLCGAQSYVLAEELLSPP